METESKESRIAIKSFAIKDGRNIHLELINSNDPDVIYIEAKNEGNEKVGRVTGRIDNFEKKVDCEYDVAESYRGNGIAGTMLQAMLNEVFLENLNTKDMINKAVLNIDMENFTSRRVAEKFGFLQTFSEGHDSVEYEMTKEQFLNVEKSNNKKLDDNTLPRNINEMGFA
ncbi:MAG: GNAT family N-acetyltransferase [Clostridia bacterium]|nr:GNAT family N-acetyltransferase [Clostridia bacterium]